MNKRLFYKIVVLDEIIKHKIEQNNIIINEKQENYIKNVLKEQEQGEKEKEVKKSQGFLDKIKSKGIFGTYNDAVTGLMNNYMKLMFGAGVFQNDDQANKAMADMAATKDPEKALDKMQKDTDKVADYLSTTPRAETPEVNRMIQRLMAASANIEKVEDKIEDAPEQADAASKETPVSIFKRQKNDPSLRSKSGAVETPLNSYIQKDLKLSAAAAQRIAKRIGSSFKSRGIPIAEIAKKIETILEQEINLPEPVSKDEKERQSGIRRRFGSDFEKAREKVARLEKELAQKEASKDPFKKQAVDMIKKDLERAKKSLSDLEKSLGGVKDTASEKSKERGAQKQAVRSQIRSIGKDAGVVGKIMTRIASDEQQILRKDANFKATLEDPQKFSKMVKSIRNMLARQLKRRGYEADEIKNLLSESNSEKLKEALAVSIKPLIEKLIRQQLKDSNGN